MPFRRIDVDATPEVERARDVEAVAMRLEGGDPSEGAAVLQEALRAGREGSVHDALVFLVDDLIALKTTLAAYDDYFKIRLTRLEDADPLPPIDPLAVTRELPSCDQWTVDIQVKAGYLSIAPKGLFDDSDNFYIARINDKESTPTSLVLQDKGKLRLTLSGEMGLIAYLGIALREQTKRPWREVKNVVVPRDMSAYEKAKGSIVTEVMSLRDKTAIRQAIIDNTTLDLYKIMDDGDRAEILRARQTSNGEGSSPTAGVAGGSLDPLGG